MSLRMSDYYEAGTSSEGRTASVRTEESGKSRCAQGKKSKNFGVDWIIMVTSSEYEWGKIFSKLDVKDFGYQFSR